MVGMHGPGISFESYDELVAMRNLERSNLADKVLCLVLLLLVFLEISKVLAGSVLDH